MHFKFLISILFNKFFMGNFYIIIFFDKIKRIYFIYIYNLKNWMYFLKEMNKKLLIYQKHKKIF